MGIQNFFKEHTKKTWVLTISLFLLIVILFFTVAYVSGKNVSEKVEIQWVSHTEYWNNDSASTIVRLADYKGLPTAIDSCNVKIVYPDKSVFVDNGAMVESSIAGNWYRTDSLVGKPLGTYEQEVTCVKGTQIIKSSQSFHLNPALQEISSITSKSSSLINSLANVNMSLTALIKETNQSVSTQISTTESNLNDALSDAKSQIINNLNNQGVNINDTLTSINATITTQLSNVNTQINSHLDDLELSLDNSLDALNQDITSQITTVLNRLDLLNQSLFNFDVKISGILEDNNQSISTQVSVAETNLNNALSTAHQSILNDLSSKTSNLNANLQNVNATIITRIDAFDTEITSNLNEMNVSLINFLEYMKLSLSIQLTETLNNLTTQLNAVKSDTSWIVSNAMNQENAAEINNRFSSLDTDLDKVLMYCSESVTNSSALCVEIYNLRQAVEILRQEQETQFNQLNETTTNTWEFLSGSISDRIDNILVQLNIIQEQNVEINSTTHQILDEMQGEIRVDIIS